MNQSRPCRSAPYRSALYLPASNARALDKAREPLANPAAPAAPAASGDGSAQQE